MYDWLGDALHGSAHVVTASRRLARVLAKEFGEQQFAEGRLAWPSPAVDAWQDWLSQLLAGAVDQEALPTRINAYQSRILWERCLRREIADPLANMSLLVRQARDTWARLREFRVPLDECQQAAIGRDQRLFAAAAASYASILERERWIDDAGAGDLVIELIASRSVTLPDKLVLAGFERVVPQVKALIESLRAAGVSVQELAPEGRAGNGPLHAFDNRDEELRCAGAWARRQLTEDSGQRLAIVVTNLERDAPRCARLVREGLAPGWQYAGQRHLTSVNVSYGQPVSSYPACEVALLLLRWLHGELSGRDVGLLLRSPFLGSGEVGGRARLELRLRRLPDRRWTPSMLLREFRDRGDDSENWLDSLERMLRVRESLPRRNTPAGWAGVIDEALGLFGWPGERALTSSEFQLVNRWRELLNELARLELVGSQLTVTEALARLGSMAGETVFQPEAEGALVHLMGPLEAAGMEFDRLWISGLGSAEWPPAGRPLPLLSRELQKRHAMPDAEPADTLDYARRVLARLLSSASAFVCSYSRTHGDSEQTATGLLADHSLEPTPCPADPGWHAAGLVGTGVTIPVGVDPVPAMRDDEKLAGGAAVLQRQLEEPFSAFVYGRLGVNPLPSIVIGLTPGVRGSLIHDALYELYRELPNQAALRSWDDAALQQRLDEAAERALRSVRRNADEVLEALLQLEKERTTALLEAVVEMDRDREPFSVTAVEQSLSATIEEVSLGLRADRIDRLDDGGYVIIDYKTGARRRFLGADGEPNDIQLVVYAYALEGDVDDLALANVDSRAVQIDGAGQSLTPDIDWAATLAGWYEVAERAARELRQGDIRLYSLHSLQSARPLSLLSRVAEYRDDA